jgi:hypothetical protein
MLLRELLIIAWNMNYGLCTIFWLVCACTSTVGWSVYCSFVAYELCIVLSIGSS